LSAPTTKYPNNPCVAIIALGGYAPDEAAFANGITYLETQGCKVKNFYVPSEKFFRFGGTDEARVKQLYAAIDDAEVDIVLMLRGGYGMSRLLPLLDFHRIAASGKKFVGHSDFTAFQMGLLASCGAMSFAGPMICDDFVREDTSVFTMRQFWECLSSTSHSINVTRQGNPSVDVSGTLWGGNLAMLTHLVGTPYFPQIDHGILFVEDINEHPYRIERMMLQLLYAGVLARQQAILFGDFSGYRLTDYDNGYDFSAMLTYLRSQVGVPILTGLPFGHTRDKATLVVGCQAHLVSKESSFHLLMSGY
jgi:muramoyltetrapeptide carboxypeptidase